MVHSKDSIFLQNHCLFVCVSFWKECSSACETVFTAAPPPFMMVMPLVISSTTIVGIILIIVCIISEIIFIFWTVCQNNRLKHSESWDIDYNDDPDCCWRWRWCRVRLWWYGGSMGGDPLEVQVLLNPPQMSTENGSVVPNPNATPNQPPLETPLHADVHWWWWPSSYYWLACVHWWCPSC